MIALDTSAKIGKSPKRAKVEKIVVQENEEESSDNEIQDDEESVAEESVDEVEMSSDEELENVNEESDEDADEENDEDNDEENDEDDEANSKVDEENDGDDEENEEDDEKNDEAVEEENMKSDGDDSEEKEADDDDDENDSKTLGNAGWADAMKKILSTNKPKKKKTLVLSRAKKFSEIVPKQQVEEKSSIQVVGEDGKVKEEVKKEVGKEEVTNVVKEKTLKRKRKDPNLTARTKPSVLDKDREKMLQKIATKGVVQLFNAVKQQQTEISKKLIEAGPLERKREKVMKNIDKHAFLDVLMGGTKSIKIDDKKSNIKNENNVDKKGDKVWSVLRDDFVMGAKLKDWDKKAPEDDDSSAPEEMDSD